MAVVWTRSPTPPRAAASASGGRPGRAAPRRAANAGAYARATIESAYPEARRPRAGSAGGLNPGFAEAARGRVRLPLRGGQRPAPPQAQGQGLPQAKAQAQARPEADPAGSRTAGAARARSAAAAAPPAPFASRPRCRSTSGAFGVRQAERLLWRAGFGPSPGHAESLAAAGLHRAVASLTRPSGAPTLTGAAPVYKAYELDDDPILPIKPSDRYGHEHLWFLDRMIRTDQPLVERMSLVWHDWFATSNDGGGRPGPDAVPERAVSPPRLRLVSTS